MWLLTRWGPRTADASESEGAAHGMVRRVVGAGGDPLGEVFIGDAGHVDGERFVGAFTFPRAKQIMLEAGLLRPSRFVDCLAANSNGNPTHPTQSRPSAARRSVLVIVRIASTAA